MLAHHFVLLVASIIHQKITGVSIALSEILALTHYRFLNYPGEFMIMHIQGLVV